MGYFFCSKSLSACSPRRHSDCFQTVFYFIQYIQLTLAADQCIDSCCINVRVSEQVGKTYNVLLHLVIIDSKEVPEIVREDFGPVNPCSNAQSFHPMKDVAAVHRSSRSGDKDAAGSNLPVPAVFPQFFAEFCGNQDLSGLSFQRHKGTPCVERSNSNKRELADTDPSRCYGLHDAADLQVSLLRCCMQEPFIFFIGKFSLLIPEGDMLCFEGTDPAVCPSEDLEEFVESREHGIGTAQSVY